MKSLSFYIHQFTHLKRSQIKGGAPHKPILLLSIIELFEKKIYKSNKIRLIPELVFAFKSIWNQLVISDHHSNFSLPFYHLSSSKFWKLIPNEGCELWINSKTSMKTFKNLNIAVRYAEIDKELSILLIEKSSRDLLKASLLDRYFSKTSINFNYLKSVFPSENIVYEDPIKYKQQVLKLKKELKDDDFQEEVFVRSGLFKREIGKIYNNTCAISGLKIDTTTDISMIDACHIIPFSESYNDTITNGIALCPNLHRAFDRGLISISNDYKVILSNQFIESTMSTYSISQFKSQKILLPKNKNHYPNLESLAHHRRRFAF